MTAQNERNLKNELTEILKIRYEVFREEPACQDYINSLIQQLQDKKVSIKPSDDENVYKFLILLDNYLDKLRPQAKPKNQRGRF